MGKPRKRCELCNHFAVSPYYSPRFGNCLRINDEQPDDPHAAFAWDYDEYSAGLIVGIHFGCTLWERKD